MLSDNITDQISSSIELSNTLSLCMMSNVDHNGRYTTTWILRMGDSFTPTSRKMHFTKDSWYSSLCSDALEGHRSCSEIHGEARCAAECDECPAGSITDSSFINMDIRWWRYRNWMGLIQRNSISLCALNVFFEGTTTFEVPEPHLRKLHLRFCAVRQWYGNSYTTNIFLLLSASTT